MLSIARTGRLVTSAAVILFLAFVSLAATPGTEVKIFATALGLGILLDATVIRSLLVPALVVLFGQWNWWLPHWLGRALLVRSPRSEPPAKQPRWPPTRPGISAYHAPGTPSSGSLNSQPRPGLSAAWPRHHSASPLPPASSS